MPFRFDNSYARLPDRFFARLAPTPVADPSLIRVNHALAQELGLDPAMLESPEGVSMLAGNSLPEGAEPLSQVYAGHQFGGWSPRLGDGRAILLGEVMDSAGRRRDIQLKGAGPTPFSRMGDGRAWLGPVLREYVVSEAMAALGIPTTRALAAVSTGEPVRRERALPGAVLTRVAASHIRVGTFQYFAARQDHAALETLVAHCIARHYPQAEGPLGLLDAVVQAQADLVARWLGVGFIHGVMNTDNCSIAGETIDYGPCAFMDAYHPGQVFSSIDQTGRYAYARQPEIAAWNLAQLATSLLSLIDPDQDRAIERASEVVNRFPARFAAAWLDVFRAKLGLSGAEEGDADLIQALMDRMAQGRADFTLTFAGLRDGSARAQFTDPEAFDRWSEAWGARRSRGMAPDEVWRRANPPVIPRNHRIEAVIAAALDEDFGPFHALVAATGDPWSADAVYALPPLQDEVVRQTFCGT
uniref:protein adenylyltransferase SelO n=1 Tax=Mesobaculum littorinae TaxID=2486419 RepID=UPI001F2418A5|nr:YdiU family protein [Mesobaculum littorinae]